MPLILNNENASICAVLSRAQTASALPALPLTGTLVFSLLLFFLVCFVLVACLLFRVPRRTRRSRRTRGLPDRRACQVSYKTSFLLLLPRLMLLVVLVATSTLVIYVDLAA